MHNIRTNMLKGPSSRSNLQDCMTNACHINSSEWGKTVGPVIESNRLLFMLFKNSFQPYFSIYHHGDFFKTSRSAFLTANLARYDSDFIFICLDPNNRYDYDISSGLCGNATIIPSEEDIQLPETKTMLKRLIQKSLKKNLITKHEHDRFILTIKKGQNYARTNPNQT